jgi:hypothetical protein
VARSRRHLTARLGTQLVILRRHLAAADFHAGISIIPDSERGVHALSSFDLLQLGALVGHWTNGTSRRHSTTRLGLLLGASAMMP